MGFCGCVGLGAALRRPDSFTKMHLRGGSAPYDAAGGAITAYGDASFTTSGARFIGKSFSITNTPGWFTIAPGSAVAGIYNVGTAGKWTLSFWITNLANQGGTYPIIFSAGDQANGSPIFWIFITPAGDDIWCEMRNSSGGDIVVYYGTTGPPNNNDWQFITITYDQALSSNNLKMYSGTTLFLQVTKAGANGTTGVPTDPAYLGSDNAAYSHNGLIDDLKVEIGHATAPTAIPTRRR